MSNRSPLIVVFDMDDTLFPEEAFVRSALAEVGRYAETKWEITNFSNQLMRFFVEGRRGNLFQLAWASLNRGLLTEDKSDELLRVYREHRPASLPWFPDTSPIIDNLAAHYPLELISDGYLPTQANKFLALGASRWIPNPIFTESIGRNFWKPSPKAFEIVMDRHPGAHCVYVADNPTKDFIAPNALGWLTVQIARPNGIYANAVTPVGGEPDFCIQSMHELSKILQQHHK